MRFHKNDDDVQRSSDFYNENHNSSVDDSFGSDSDNEYNDNRNGNQRHSTGNNKRQTNETYQNDGDIEHHSLLPRGRKPDYSAKIIIILVIVLMVTFISLIVTLTNIGNQKIGPVFDKNCSDPPVVSDSTVTRSGIYSIYSCQEEFYPIGESTIVCQDGAWSTVKFKCSRYCGSPPNIRYSTHQTSGNMAGAVTSYFCLSGYVPVGETNIICNTNGQWSPINLSCLKDCGRPPNQPSSNTVYTTTYMGSKVIYYCYSGYSMVGNPIVMCQSDGKWSANNFNCVDKSQINNFIDTTKTVIFKQDCDTWKHKLLNDKGNEDNDNKLTTHRTLKSEIGCEQYLTHLIPITIDGYIPVLDAAVCPLERKRDDIENRKLL